MRRIGADVAFHHSEPGHECFAGKGLRSSGKPSRRIQMHSIALLVAVLAAAPLALGAQAASLYVIRVNGTWVQHSRSDTKPLVSLDKIPSDAMLELTQGSVTDTTLSVSIRNPRTLGLATLKCSPATPCRGKLRVSALKFERAGPEAGTVVEGLYHDLGTDEALRSRIRLVGARGDGREFGILVLAAKGSTIDLSELRQRVGEDAAGAVVRFCDLAANSGWDDCLESRQLLPGDCSLDEMTCNVKLAPGAYRADLYDRDRRMLRSVPRGVGFAAIVVQDKLASTQAARDSIEGTLRKIAGSLSPDERRALEGAAVRALAASSR